MFFPEPMLCNCKDVVVFHMLHDFASDDMYLDLAL